MDIRNILAGLILAVPFVAQADYSAPSPRQSQALSPTQSQAQTAELPKLTYCQLSRASTSGQYVTFNGYARNSESQGSEINFQQDMKTPEGAKEAAKNLNDGRDHYNCPKNLNAEVIKNLKPGQDLPKSPAVEFANAQYGGKPNSVVVDGIHFTDRVVTTPSDQAN